MARSRESFSKKEVQNRKDKKRKDKVAKKLARKENEGSGSADDMIAYVDEFGNITSEPPDPAKKTKTKASDIEVSIPKNDSAPRDLTRTGIVTNFNDSKGFGFIRDSVTGESYFVHINNSNDDLSTGNKVKFETERGQKGPIAVNVSIVK